MAAKATSDSADIPLGGIFHGVRPPGTSAEHDLCEAAALWAAAGSRSGSHATAIAWCGSGSTTERSRSDMYSTPRRTTRRSFARPPTTRVNPSHNPCDLRRASPHRGNQPIWSQTATCVGIVPAWVSALATRTADSPQRTLMHIAGSTVPALPSSVLRTITALRRRLLPQVLPTRTTNHWGAPR